MKALADMSPDGLRCLVQVANERERPRLEAVTPVLPEKAPEALADPVPDPVEQDLKRIALELRPALPRL